MADERRTAPVPPPLTENQALGLLIESGLLSDEERAGATDALLRRMEEQF